MRWKGGGGERNEERWRENEGDEESEGLEGGLEIWARRED